MTVSFVLEKLFNFMRSHLLIVGLSTRCQLFKKEFSWARKMEQQKTYLSLSLKSSFESMNSCMGRRPEDNRFFFKRKKNGFLRQGFSVVLEPVLELALVDQTGLEITEPPASASLVLGLKAAPPPTTQRDTRFCVVR